MSSAIRFFAALAFLAAACPAGAQSPARGDILRGEYGRYRANNDLLSYHLDIRVDPAKQLLSGKNTIRFRMLKDDSRIQIDLYAYLKVEKILLGANAAQVQPRDQRRLHRFPADVEGRPRIRDRFLLLRQP